MVLRLPRLAFFFLVFVSIALATSLCHGKKISIGDDLGAEDEDEEDLAMWGLKSRQETLDSINERRRALPEHTYDISKLSDKEYIAEMSLRNIRAPTLTFVKLVPDPSRTQDDVEVLARKWTELFRSGQVPVNFYAASSQQIIALVEDGETALMAKKFFLEQPEVYEWEVENTHFRRPGDTVPYESLEMPSQRMKEAERRAAVAQNTRRWQERHSEA